MAKRAALVALLTGVLSIVGTAGPLLSLDLVPSGGYWVPYIGAGYDTGWSLVTFSVTMEHALVLNGWYTLQAARLFPISRTGNTRWGGIVGAWAELCDGSFTQAIMGIGPMVTVQMQGMNVALKLFLFTSVGGNSAMFGFQPAISFWFDFMPQCGTTEPGCEVGW